ncbi:hypothetical protein [Caviibacter abscessus]|uniref:hypothetical protein n=1 Tax=Caviibacter abscessus TaxID=1766719 RepID=UPI0008331955|nr:hypothetical protein [Caviibacter abscessus]
MNKYIDKYVDYLMILFTLIFSIIIFSIKKSKYDKVIYELNILENKFLEKEIQLKDLYSKYKLIDSDKNNKLVKINEFKNNLDKSYSISSNDFKKIIYSFSRESSLILEEITKEQKIFNFLNFSLNYLTIKFKGDLESFSKFIYLIQNSDKYIDTKRISFDIMSDNFIVNIGHISSGGANE